MSSTYKYDSKKESLIIGVLKVKDYGEDTKIKEAYSEDLMGHTIGTDGDIQIFKNYNDSSTIEVSVLAMSPLNAAMTIMAKARETFPVTRVSENWGSGNVGGICTDAYFQKIPDKNVANDPSSRTWVIVCPQWGEDFGL